MDAERRERIRYYAYAALVGVLLLLNVTGIWKTVFGIDTAAFIALLAGYKTFHGSISALLEKRISADLALCIAVIAALSVGEYLAAAEAMFIVQVGEGLESYAAGRTEAAIQRFVEQLPRRARLLRGGEEVEVDAEELAPEDLILVRAGEKIPADGVIEDGVSSIDESSVTGEPLPRDKQPGDEVFSGTLNGNALLRVRVKRAGSDTTLARVARLVEEARGMPAPVERRADRYAKYFLPALLLAGALTWYFTRDWLRTVAVLIVACPCALILATPTAMVAAIGGLARRGILVRGGTVLEQAAEVDTMLFDKTGTITEGRFELVRVVAVDRGEDQVLALAAAAESGSGHVLAQAIVEEAGRRGLRLPAVRAARILPGRGVECVDGAGTIRAGNAAFLEENGVHRTAPLVEEADRLGATAVLVAVDTNLAGAILLRDRIRDGMPEAVAGLRELEIRPLVMLTGDRRRAAEVIAREAGLDDVAPELLPEQKLEHVRRVESEGRVAAMAGDGINDAPALAAAGVGIAVKGASDLTAEAADAVYLPHTMENLPLLFRHSRRAVRTAWQNIVLFAGVVNGAAVIACATGKLGPAGAAFTHQISSFLVMMNSLLLLRVPSARPPRWRQWLDSPAVSGAREWVRGFDWRRAASRWPEYRKPAAYVAAALLLLSGFYIIPPEETGVIQRFGRKILPNREPGLHYKLPWPVETLTRIKARQVHVVEIGFRSSAPAPELEPAAYEWNAQHRGGRFQRKPEEALMLTGDQNLIELNATVHYSLERPDDFLFRHVDGETAVRTAAESAIQAITTSTTLDEALTTGRAAVESRAMAELQKRLDRYETGVRVLGLKLQDVHPSLEVVDAFREVSGAFEEKNRLINEAEGYANEQVALARGGGRAALENARAYNAGRLNRSAGDAARFTAMEQAFRLAPGPTATRLYLETVEQVLPGKKKLIVDSQKGRRHLIVLEDGVEVPQPLTLSPGRPRPAVPEE